MDDQIVPVGHMEVRRDNDLRMVCANGVASTDQVDDPALVHKELARLLDLVGHHVVCPGGKFTTANDAGQVHIPRVNQNAPTLAIVRN